MQQEPPRLSWPEIILLALFPLGFIIAAGGICRTMLDAFTAMAAFAAITFIAWLGQLTPIRRPPRPTTKRDWIWNADVLVTRPAL